MTVTASPAAEQALPTSRISRVCNWSRTKPSSSREFSTQLAETCDEQLYTLDRRIAALLSVTKSQFAGENHCPRASSAWHWPRAAALGLDADRRLLLIRRIERHLHLALPRSTTTSTAT